MQTVISRKYCHRHESAVTLFAMYPVPHASSSIAAFPSCTRHNIADSTVLPGLGMRLWMQQQQHKQQQPVTEKQDQASAQFWLDLQLSKSQALLHPDLKAVNSSFEALKSAHGAPDRVQ